MLQSRDIRNLKNQLKKRSLGGGYDVGEVDQHFADLATRWDDLSEELRMAHSRVVELEDKLKHYEKVELALQEALETARDTARRTEESANRKAGLIIEEAELRAQRIIQEAEQERYGLRQDLSHLTNRQNEVAARLRSFLMSELEMLAQFQGDDPIGFIKLVSPDRTAEERTLPRTPAALEEAPVEAVAEETPTPEVADEAPEADTPAAQPPVVETPAMEAPAMETPTMEASAMEPAEPEAPAMETPAEDSPAMEAAADTEVPGVPAGTTPSDALTEDLDTAEPFATLDDEDLPAASRRIIPRSPWPDVESPRIPPSIWAPVPEPNQAAEDSSPDASEENDPDSGGLGEPMVRPEPPSAAPSWSSPGAPPPSSAPEPTPGTDTSKGWSFRSLVTGDDDSPEAKDKHHEAVRRIMEDMD